MSKFGKKQLLICGIVVAFIVLAFMWLVNIISNPLAIMALLFLTFLMLYAMFYAGSTYPQFVKFQYLFMKLANLCYLLSTVALSVLLIELLYMLALNHGWFRYIEVSNLTPKDYLNVLMVVVPLTVTKLPFKLDSN